jgi:NADH-quinone oxidoreductase subunit C
MGVEKSAENSHDLPVSLKLLAEGFPDEVRETRFVHGDAMAVISPGALRKVMEFLKNDTRLLFDVLVDITAVDYLGQEPRFEVVYHLLSLSHNQRLRIKVGVNGEKPAIESMTALWGNANWLEREVWDMFGIEFERHPDLRRILLYPEFQGHPLRKDYPIRRRQPLIGPKN